MADSKLPIIAEKLLVRSQKGEVAWQSTVKSHEFIVSFPDYSLIVHQKEYPSASADYGLSLTDEQGTKIESLILESPSQEGYSTMDNLFEQA